MASSTSAPRTGCSVTTANGSCILASATDCPAKASRCCMRPRASCGSPPRRDSSRGRALARDPEFARVLLPGRAGARGKRRPRWHAAARDRQWILRRRRPPVVAGRKTCPEKQAPHGSRPRAADAYFTVGGRLYLRHGGRWRSRALPRVAATAKRCSRSSATAAAVSGSAVARYCCGSRASTVHSKT